MTAYLVQPHEFSDSLLLNQVVAPSLISQCYNCSRRLYALSLVVAPSLISQCYNIHLVRRQPQSVVAPSLISQCYNTPTGNPYLIRISRFILLKKWD
ncbi:hypothetical protein HMPREF9120_01803 [Neisseria sp. oral taxon 020 str. F0370]|nr:hypothetical protein HMPREF9120_01803 [Neisseria sp. oral taxon 020 str. F0370]